MDIVNELECHQSVNYKCAKSEDINLWIVQLNPGDILLIPPYWWHHVVSVTNSISLHFWVNSEEYLLANRDIYSLPIPFEMGWSLSLKTVFLRVFFKMILESMSEEFGIADDLHLDLLLLRQLYHLRYEALVLQNDLDFDDVIKENVYNVCNENEQLQLLYTENFFMDLSLTQKDKVSVAKMLQMDINDDGIMHALKLKFERMCMTISNKFRLIQDHSLRLLLIKNYIEYIRELTPPAPISRIK